MRHTARKNIFSVLKSAQNRKGWLGGVIKQSFAVQAGREVRVIVQSEMFDDLASQKLARDIAKKIEDELDYPGQIKVTVVREFRTTEIAK